MSSILFKTQKNTEISFFSSTNRVSKHLCRNHTYNFKKKQIKKKKNKLIVSAFLFSIFFDIANNVNFYPENKKTVAKQIVLLQLNYHILSVSSSKPDN
jgi:hypothetical protein